MVIDSPQIGSVLPGGMGKRQAETNSNRRHRTGNTVGRCRTPRWGVANSPDPCDEAKG